ncbi:DUF3951 domain-containing protein [Priestia koreensis]|uniref:DUF3951 domain-containing protein n=1 Tax=Priestia koreensis TaxID=284581 RepID=A0A0M0KS19_9BACI|nr:DUF3951 domain-containing protein [Priestia koreensis]KOO41193.1 hypothetical protein AMD01_19845 [Priestia koreensis]
MIILLLFVVSIYCLMAAIVVFVIYQMIVKKKCPTSFYTPSNHITGQSITSLYEGKKYKVKEDDSGDGKN